MPEVIINGAQAQYIEGRNDGRRYMNDMHEELDQKYEQGTPAYRMGFDSERVIQPDDYAS